MDDRAADNRQPGTASPRARIAAGDLMKRLAAVILPLAVLVAVPGERPSAVVTFPRSSFPKEPSSHA